MGAGRAGDSKTFRHTKFMEKNNLDFARLHDSISLEDPNPENASVRLTVCVTRWWVGQDNTI
jgi:hypothetical protein